MDWLTGGVPGQILLGICGLLVILGVWTAILLWPIPGRIAAGEAWLADLGPDIEIGVYDVEKRPSCPGVEPVSVRRAYMTLRLDIDREVYREIDRVEVTRIDPAAPDQPQLIEQFIVDEAASGSFAEIGDRLAWVVRGLNRATSEREMEVRLAFRCARVEIGTPYMHIIPSPDWVFLRTCRFEVPIHFAIDEEELAALEGRAVDPSRIAVPSVSGTAPSPQPEVPADATPAEAETSDTQSPDPAAAGEAEPGAGRVPTLPLDRPALWRVTVLKDEPPSGRDGERRTVLVSREFPALSVKTHRDAFAATFTSFKAERTGRSIQVEIDVPADVRRARLRTGWMAATGLPQFVRTDLSAEAGRTVRRTVEIGVAAPVHLSAFFEAEREDATWTVRGTVFEDQAPFFRCP